MIKTHLKDLLDIQFILILVILFGVTMVLTMVFSDKVKDFKQNYKRKFTIYVLSLVFGYVLVSLLGFNKLFDELGDEFLFYQLASLLFGIVHVYFYRWYFDSFDSKSLPLEMFFSVVVILYGGFPFVIIYTALHGLNFTYLLCGHFLAFIIPTGVYITFELMMRIPPKIYMSWKIPKDHNFKAIKSEDLKEMVLVTLLIKKKEDSEEYASFRAKAPMQLDFEALFYHTITGYNDKNKENKIETETNGEGHNWVFFIQTKWYQPSRYIAPNFNMHMNGIGENSVIVCERQKESGLHYKKRLEDANTIILDQKNLKINIMIVKS